MPEPVSHLFLPPTSLAACVFGAIYRDTRGAGLRPDQRVNHFPASPLVSVTRVLHGELEVLQVDGERSGPEVAVLHAQDGECMFVTGPTRGPLTSLARGDIAAVTLGVYHDAWLRLGGDPGYRAAPPEILAALERFARTQSTGTPPDAGWAEACIPLEQAWRAGRPRGWRPVAGMSDWARAAITRAVLGGPGRSLRAVERRLKRQSGQTRRTLDFFAAFEGLHRVWLDRPGGALADIALAAGYADQSHMGRAVKRATGFTPARLNRAILTEEAFWCYRLLGARF